MSDPQERGERGLNRLKDACAALSSEFEAVQIIASRHDPDRGGTLQVAWGIGSWYARYGMLKAWLAREDGELAKGDGAGEEE